MPMRTTQWKWMALGGLLSLMAIVGVSRWMDNRANASGETAPSQPLPLNGKMDPARTTELPAPVPPMEPADVAIPMKTASDNAPAPTSGPVLPPISEGPAPTAPAPLPGAFPETTPTGSLAPVTTLPLPQAGPMPKDLPPTAAQPLPMIQQIPAVNTTGGVVPASFREQSPAPVEPLAPSTPVAPAPITGPEAPQAPLTPPTTPPLPPTGSDKLTPPEVAVPPTTPVTQPTLNSIPPQAPMATATAPVPFTPAPLQPSEPGEPPLTPAAPTQVYRVRHAGETVREIARKTLGTVERTPEILRLNPEVQPTKVFSLGETVMLPADACIPMEDVETVKPLPAMRRETQVKAKVVLPLTGTFPCNLDEKRVITLPRSIREQLGNTNTVLVSPGPDQCLWLTNQAHLDRLAERLEKSSAREVDVRVFKRLYFAQTEKIAMSNEGRITISEKLAQFAGLHQEVVLVGIDDHFELWDVSRWRQYTQEKSTAVRTGNDSE